MFICLQKINFISNFFLRYCKDTVNLLFWVLWECFTIPIKIIILICSMLSCSPACKKINFITHFFLKILQRNSKLAIFGNLGMPDHTHQKWALFDQIWAKMIFPGKEGFQVLWYILLFLASSITESREQLLF